MPKNAPVTPDVDELAQFEGEDVTMIPGHPQCNYEKFMAAQPQVMVTYLGDQQNPQFTHYKVRFNTYEREYPYNQPVKMPRPLAINVLLTGKATTTDAELMESLKGQIGRPIEGPIPGPFSGDYVTRF